MKIFFVATLVLASSVCVAQNLSDVEFEAKKPYQNGSFG